MTSGSSTGEFDPEETRLRFVEPELPDPFVLVFLDDPPHDLRTRLGPFHRRDVIREDDGAIVIYEYGALPVRLGVVRQEGDILHLYPEGRIRLEAAQP